MKFILLHGDHTLDSYQRLQKFIDTAKNRSWQVVKIDPSDSLSLSEKMVSNDLFNEKKLFIIENLGKIDKKQLTWLKKNFKRLSDTLVIFHRGTILKNLLKLLPKPTKIEEYKLPKYIFKFMESFYPGNSKNCLKLLHETTNSQSPDFVFNLLCRHLRDLYWVQAKKDSLPYPAWRINKLSSQAKKFKEGKIKDIISKMAEADMKIKTSKADYQNSLDFIIVSELE
ncbi:MAG: hypothetical protein P8Y17_00810 [Patescibacteria group bacterium]